MAIEAIKKKYPIIDENGQPSTYPTFASQVFNSAGEPLENADGVMEGVTAGDALKLGGKAPEYYIQPRNLLDNSDFSNPVNQRGSTSYATTGANRYTIDRWIGLNNTAVYLSDGYIELAPQTTVGRGFKQLIENPSRFAGKTLTAAVCVVSVIGSFGLYINDGEEVGITTTESGIFTVTKTVSDDVSELFAQISPTGTTDTDRVCVAWAALYEGEYTADTLPPYVPKGYGAELAECLRYFELIGMEGTYPIGSSYVTNSTTSTRWGFSYTKKRVAPTISLSTSALGIVNNGAYCTVSGVSVDAGERMALISLTSSGLTAKTPATVYASKVISIDADL